MNAGRQQLDHAQIEKCMAKRAVWLKAHEFCLPCEEKRAMPLLPVFTFRVYKGLGFRVYKGVGFRVYKGLGFRV